MDVAKAEAQATAAQQAEAHQKVQEAAARQQAALLTLTAPALEQEAHQQRKI